MNLKITQMTPASFISGSEYFPIVQGGINKRAAIDDLKVLMVNSIPTISDLKLRPGRVQNETVDVLGYYTRFDGGGGKYYWNSSSTATDDGGSVIAVTGVTTGRWIAVFDENIVDVKRFGAKGDGVQDELQFLEKAASYCGRANKAFTLYLPNGVYRISNQWLIGAKIVPVESELIQYPYYSAPSINYGVESNWRPFSVKGAYDTVIHADFSSDTLKSAIYYCIRMNTGTVNRDEFGGEISNLKVVGQGSYSGSVEQTIWNWQSAKNQVGISVVSGINMRFDNLYFKNMHRGMILNTSYNATLTQWVSNYCEYGWFEIGSNTGNRNCFHCSNYELAYDLRSALTVWDGMWAEGPNTVLKVLGSNNTIKGFYNEAHGRALDNDRFVIEIGLPSTDPNYNPDGVNGTVFDGLFLPASYVNLAVANGIRMRDGARNVTIIGGHVLANVQFDNAANNLVYINSWQRSGTVTGPSKIYQVSSDSLFRNLTVDSSIGSTTDLNFNVSSSNVINHRVNNQVRGVWNSNGLGLGVTASLNNRLEVAGNYKFNGSFYDGSNEVTSPWYNISFPDSSSSTVYVNIGDFSGLASGNYMNFDVEMSSGWGNSNPISIGRLKKNIIALINTAPGLSVNVGTITEDIGSMGRVFQIGNLEFSGSLLRVPIKVIDSVTGSDRRGHVRVKMSSWSGVNISRFNPSLTGLQTGSFGTREYQKVNDRLGIGLGNNIQPSHSLDVSGSIRFTDSLVYNNIAYKLPLSLPATGSILVHNGSGSLGWKSADISTVNSLTDLSTIVWNLGLGKNATVTLGGNRTLSIVSSSVGDYGTLVVKQDVVGDRSIVLPSGSKVINGGSGSISLSSVGNSVDILSFYYDGTNYYWNKGLNYT